MTQAVAAGTLVGGTPLQVRVEVDVPPWLQHPDPLGCLARQDLFFPPDYTQHYRDRIEAAKALCADCPVRDLCLAWAVPQADLEGIWAATTPPDRRRLRRAAREAAA